MDFLNEYLMKNRVVEINITKDRRSTVFNYKAEITMNDNIKYQMVLGSQESFLAKLDLVQRQMGKTPNQFIPVKYVNSEDQMKPMMFNAFIVLLAGAALY